MLSAHRNKIDKFPILPIRSIATIINSVMIGNWNSLADQSDLKNTYFPRKQTITVEFMARKSFHNSKMMFLFDPDVTIFLSNFAPLPYAVITTKKTFFLY